MVATRQDALRKRRKEVKLYTGRVNWGSKKGYLLAFLIGAGVSSTIFLTFGNNIRKEEPNYSEHLLSGFSQQIPKNLRSQEIDSLYQLLALPPDELEDVDIGLMNLLCATGLPGSEKLDINKCLVKLDYWAEHVRKDTELRVHNFNRNPAKYDNSENVFRMVNLVLTLKEDMGVEYNLENIKRVDFTDSREIFVHGPLSGGHHGSCTNLPVLCIAVARRLGYPVKLVATSEHYFLRWEDATTDERFNIEVSCRGTDTPPDNHYKNWPRKLSELDYHHGYLLKSLTASEELAAFLHLRGDALTDAGRIAEAQVAYAHAYCLVPDTTVHFVNLAATVDKELERLAHKDYIALGKRVAYTVCRSTEPEDLANAWKYRYPKVSETVAIPVRQGEKGNHLHTYNR